MSNGQSVVVNVKQRGNSLLESLTVATTFSDDITADFVINPKCCILFLSARYHTYKPEYIQQRIDQLKWNTDQVSIMLFLIDTPLYHEILLDVNMLCFIHNLVLQVVFTNEDAAKLIKIYKMYENKPVDAIMDTHIQQDNLQYAITFLSTIKPLNKTDAILLLKTFKSLSAIAVASKEDLLLVGGLGYKKVEALYAALRAPITFD